MSDDIRQLVRDRKQAVTPIQWKVLRQLEKRGPQTCSSVGDMLWGNVFRHQQVWARPAGKILHSLQRKNLVESRMVDGLKLWQIRPIF